MALRFRSTVNVLQAGSTIAHGLGVIPDELSVVPMTNASGATIYRLAASTSTSIFLASISAATSAFVIAAVNHSIIA